MKTNAIENNFSGGEISPTVVGREDLPIYKQVAEWIQNFIVLPQGCLVYRYGTKYVHHTRLNRPAEFIPFEYNDIQSYLIEVTDQKFRFYKSTGIVTETGINITGITNSNPGVITVSAHGYSVGQEFFVNGVEGMTGINGKSFIVSGATTNTITLKDEFGNAASTIDFGTYTSGGTVSRVYEIDSPFLEADIFNLQWAQKADGMYIVNRNYEPRLLLRMGDANWTLSTYTRSPDPFDGPGKWPGAVCFTSDSRLVFGGTTNEPETFWGSRTPDPTAGDRFDNFDTGGTSPVATSSYKFTLAALQGKVDSIRWISNTNKYLVIGTFGSVRNAYGSNVDSPPTPLAINIKTVSPFGVLLTQPAPNGAQIFYTQRDGGNIRSLDYSFEIQDYESTDRNLISLHITKTGIKKITKQSGNPEILWAARNDGVLIGLTYVNSTREQKYGWHRHEIGGNAVVETVASLSRETLTDRVYICANRTINGNTVRYVEYITDKVEFPEPVDFFTNRNTSVDDDKRYNNVLYEAQKNCVQVDAASVYDGYNLFPSITMTPGTGANIVDSIGVVFTTSAPMFTSSMVGREIWKRYNSKGIGGGRARIDTVTDSTHASCTILSPFDNSSSISTTQWALTTASVSGLGYLEGATVQIVKDGSVQDVQVVQNGRATTQSQGSKIVVGLGYTGVMKTVAVNAGGQTGPAVSKIKNIKEFFLRMLNGGGISFGTSLYYLQDIVFDTTARVTGRPVPLFTGIKQITYEDGHEREKHLYLVQEKPLPCTILSLEPYTVTTEKG